MSQLNEMRVAKTQSTPSQVALRREVIDRIRSSMSAADARAVDMMLENRDWVEIGNALDINPDTVRMRVRRAIDRVRQEIGVDGPVT